MATKTITAAYASGYALNAAYDTLQIAASASVGGTGVTTSAVHSSSIFNYGVVDAAGVGITLADGGKVSNQDPGVAGLIRGTTAILVKGGAGSIVNAGTIESTATVTGSNTVTTASVVLQAGGLVTQTTAGGKIDAGVVISGGVGTVVNRGVIGAPESHYGSNNFESGWSVQLSDGGSVNNGPSGFASATLTHGVDIAGGVGTVINNGTIGGPTDNNSGYITLTNSIVLDAGGSITNGLTGDILAGVSVAGAATIVNNGRIGYGGTAGYKSNPEPSVKAGAALTLTNGGVKNTAAFIGNGILTSKTATATILNYGTISSVPGGGASPGYGVDLAGGGLVINGSLADTKATIGGRRGVSVFHGGTVINFGTITANKVGAHATTPGKAIVFTGPATLVEEATGVLGGDVIGAGAGSKLDLAADAGTGTITGLGHAITGFPVITVGKGADWHFAGANLIAKGVSLAGDSAIIDDGAMTDDGKIRVHSLFRLSQGAKLSIGATGFLYLEGAANLDVAAGATGTGLTNAGWIEKDGGGTATIDHALTNTGYVLVNEGTLAITGAVKGAGRFNIEGPSTLEFGSSVAAGATIDMASPNDLLKLDKASSFAATVTLFRFSSQKIDLRSIAFGATTTVSYSGTKTSGVLTVAHGSQIAKIALLGQYTAANFKALSDGAGGTDIRYVPPSTPAASLISPGR